ncbi:outer membrane beta-barrel protein [Endozoicomonas sp.]|uniref:outer membrane beta-barrel protein n=1 Tax=Endozoicomonas sp. TaxID=1892382 RepID=UPI002884E4A3|nr:outer membrane beta-barrel protein [Endozoicomonas sp.]
MFKQITTAPLAASVLMSSSAVMANDWFVGATLGSSDHDIKADGGNGQFKDSYTGLRAGTFINDNIRLYANLGRIKGSDKADIEPGVQMDQSINNEELSFSVDYIDNLFQLESTKYFVGGTLGYNRMKVDIDVKELGITVDKASKKDSGALYGVQLGLIQEFTPAISAELGYRYIHMDNKVKLEFTDPADTMKLKQKDQQMVYINVSYQF